MRPAAVEDGTKTHTEIFKNDTEVLTVLLFDINSVSFHQRYAWQLLNFQKFCRLVVNKIH